MTTVPAGGAEPYMEQRLDHEPTPGPHQEPKGGTPAFAPALSLPRWSNHTAPAALAVLLVLVYLPSLTNQLLNWDDPWLITRNSIVRTTTLASLVRIFGDFSLEGRMILGAEYLPMRDLSLWLEMPLHGLSPRALRLTNLAYYIAACLAFRAYFARLGLSTLAAEVAALVFALHPVHVESAAWLAGRKDVLALLFVGLALRRYADARPRPLLVGLFLSLAYFSKSMSVVAPVLLLATDLWLRRRPQFRWFALYVLLTASALLVHGRVGSLVGMTAEPLGGSAGAAIASMGPVWLRYFWLALDPSALSIVQEVPVRGFDAPSLAGWIAVLSLLGAALALALRRQAFAPLALVLFWFAPLAPVSQVLVPLQNRMADRYLFLSVLALALLGALFIENAKRAFGARHATLLGALIGLWFALGSSMRSSLFGDSVDVFRDATRKTHLLATAPFQLGIALEERGDLAGAELSYRQAIDRGSGEPSRRATNNLAKLYAGSGRSAEALAVLELGVRVFPGDPKMRMNRVRILARLGKLDQARAALAVLQRDFPGYDPDSERARPHFGP